MRKFDKHERGFSLIEVLVTVSILSIILTIAVPSYFGYVRSSRTAEAKTNLQSLALLLEQRRADNGSYCPAINTNYTYTENNDGTIATQTIVTNFLTGFRPKLAATGAALLYDYTIRCATTITFTITAAPATGRGAPTGNLTLTETGVKTGW